MGNGDAKGKGGHKSSVKGASVPVVAVGASAGGLAAIEAFLAAVPPGGGFAVVVIQHLDPTSSSLLPELLARSTELKVRPAEDGLQVAANEVYVIPPGAFLSIASGRLRLSPWVEGKTPRMPVDLFLNALAADRGPRGVGVILSGGGGDGAQGLKVLKEAGGLTLVQDPSEAQHDSMPRTAILAARPDQVLRVSEMPAVIARYVAHDYVKSPYMAAAPSVDEAQQRPSFEAFVDTIRAGGGPDFAPYKTGTLIRRIERRMALNGLDDRAAYLAMLRASPAEVDALVRDLLINVTGFFRDPDVFAALAEAIPDLLRSHPVGQPFRVWVAGCSTGEEAYSVGMLLLEKIAEVDPRLELQIFATDIDEDALQYGRFAAYPESIQGQVSPERLQRFFIHDGGQYRIAKPLRDAVIFSRHDLLRDPPFSRLDLVTCRNLLIYLRAETQRHVLATLHFGLREGGLMVLGSAESANSFQSLFEAIDDKRRIYRRRGQGVGARFPPNMFEAARAPDTANQAPRASFQHMTSLTAMVQRALLETYSPAAVATNRQMAPLYYFGPVDRYLQLAPGEASQDLLALAREGLRPKLREAVGRALRSRRRAAVHGAWFKRDGKTFSVTIEAQPVGEEADDLVLVSFLDELPSAGARHAAESAPGAGDLELTRQLLGETRRELNRTIHDLREANEELKLKNEEFLSANEELESSKEELQSLNEELTTVNTQLRQTLELRQQTSTDLANLLNSSPIATILLDEQLRIKTLNPRMRSLFSLLETDVGRPLADLLPKFDDPQLQADAGAAVSAGAVNQREIRADQGVWYQRTVLPYRTERGDIEGAVVAFADVSQEKQAEVDASAARTYAETVVDSIRDPLAVLDAGLTIISANAAFASAFGLGPERGVGRVLRNLDSPVLARAELSEQVAAARLRDAVGSQFDLTSEQPDGVVRIWQIHVRWFDAPPREEPLVLLMLEDVTEQKRVSRRQFELLVDALPGAFLAVDKQRKIRFSSRQVSTLLGYAPEDLIGHSVEILVPTPGRERHAALHAAFVANPTPRAMGSGLDIQGITKDGQLIPLDIALGPVATADGPLTVAAIHDLRPLKRGEAEMREAKAAAERANRSKSSFLAAASHDLRQPLQTIGLLHAVLERRIADAETRAILARLDDSVGYMTELLDTLLDLNQVEAGAITPDIADMPVAPALARAVADLAPLAVAKGLSLKMVPSSAMVRSDRRLLARIVENLLSNAVKYTYQGKVLVGCRRRGGELLIEIWDTGGGLSPASAAKVFDEFYRIEEDGGGAPSVGLGLHIVKRFADLLGHKVEVRSEPDRGSVFRLTVRLARSGREVKQHREGARAAEGPRPRAVLVVADDLGQREALRALLELEGRQVVSVGGGEEALRWLAGADAPQLVAIVADLSLRGAMSGLEAVQRLRDEAGAPIPALFIGSHGEVMPAHDARAGASVFIARPVKAAELLGALDTLVQVGSPDAPRPPRRRTSSSPAPQPQDATIAVIDDDPGVRDSLRALLDAEDHRAATYASVEAFLKDPNRSRFRCLVVDLSLPGVAGGDFLDRLRDERSNTPVVMVTGHADLATAVAMMRRGAFDFLQKPVQAAALLASVARALNRGERSSAQQVEDVDLAGRLATLTEREHQTLDGILAGQATKAIAAALGISQRTTEHHRQSVMRKLGVRSIATLARRLALSNLAN